MIFGGKTMTFSQQIQALRKEKGWSQETLAKTLYVTRQSVSQWENDKAMPAVDLLVKLSQLFDISLDRLLGKDEEDKAPLSTAQILTNKKDLRKAGGFRFISTVAIIITATLSVLAYLLLWTTTVRAEYQTVYGALELDIDFPIEMSVISAGAAAALFFLIMRFVFYKRDCEWAKGFTKSIEFFSDCLVLHGSDGSPISFFYANLKKVYENDNYLYITLPNRRTVIIDKASFDEERDAAVMILTSHKNYRSKKLVSKDKRQISAGRAKLLLIVNNFLFVACIALTVLFIDIKYLLFVDAKTPDALRWLMYLTPYITGAAALALGLTECIKKLRAKRLVISGCALLAVLVFIFVNYNIRYQVFDFNQRELSPEAFLKIAEENNMVVREANQDHPEDYLWECYEALSEDGEITITYMHFIEDVRGLAVRSAHGAFYSMQSTEMNKIEDMINTWSYDTIINALYTTSGNEGVYSYVSLNCYTVICVSSKKNKKGEVAEILSDCKLKMPY